MTAVAVPLIRTPAGPAVPTAAEWDAVCVGRGNAGPSPDQLPPRLAKYLDIEIL